MTITSIGETDCVGCSTPLVFERSTVAPARGAYQYDREHATPFHGFVMPPGTYRYVVIETRFDHCESYSPGSGVTFLSLPVGYRSWFTDHEVQVPMPFSLDVRFRGPECPGGLQAAA